MRCQTCGGEISTAFNECETCNTPLGSPPLYQGVPTYRVSGIGLAASIAVGIAVFAELLLSLFPLVGRLFAENAARTNDADQLLLAALIEAGLAVSYLLVYVTAGVLVIIWFYRARRNLDAFPGARPYLGNGWAIAGWLVPFANFVVPCRVMANLARDSLWRAHTPVLVGVWWAAWLINSVYGQFVSMRDEDAYENLAEPTRQAEFDAYVDYYTAALSRNMVPMVAAIIAGILLIILIRRISAAQDARIAKGQPSQIPGDTVMPGMIVTSPQVTGEAGGTIGA